MCKYEYNVCGRAGTVQWGEEEEEEEEGANNISSGRLWHQVFVKMCEIFFQRFLVTSLIKISLI